MKGKSAVELFIETQRAKGASDQDIRHQLLDAGWQMDIIQWAMNDVTGERAQPLVLEETELGFSFRRLLSSAKLSFVRR